MVGVIDCDDADAVDLGTFDRFTHAARGDEEAESVVPVEMGGDGRLFGDSEVRSRIDAAVGDAREVLLETGETVCILSLITCC